MALELTHKAHRKYLRVSVNGTREKGNEAAEIVAIWTKVAGFCEAYGLSKILAVLKIEGKIPFQSAFSMEESFAKTGWKKGYQLAIVASAETLSLNILLSEKLWASMGFTMKIFHGERAARKWLLNFQDAEKV